MNHGMVTYRSVSFPCNPAEFTVSYKKQLGETFSPYLGSIVQEVGQSACVISGSGVLMGEQAWEHFTELKEAFEQSGSALLKVGGLAELYAFFQSLELEAQAPNKIGFRFTFIEDCQKTLSTQEVSE